MTFGILLTYEENSRLTVYANGAFEMLEFNDWIGSHKEDYTGTGIWILTGDDLFITSED